MGSVYSAELWSQHDFTSVDVTIPDDERWVVRTCTLFASGLGGALWFQIQRLADSLTLYDQETGLGVFDAFSTANELRLVLMESATYTFKSPGGGDVALFGYVLTDP